MIPLTNRLFIPPPTIFASGVSPVHCHVDLRQSAKKLLNAHLLLSFHKLEYRYGTVTKRVYGSDTVTK